MPKEYLYLQQDSLPKRSRSGAAWMFWQDHDDLGWFLAVRFTAAGVRQVVLEYVRHKRVFDPIRTVTWVGETLRYGEGRVQPDGRVFFEPWNVEMVSMRDVMAFERMWPRLMAFIERHDERRANEANELPRENPREGRAGRSNPRAISIEYYTEGACDLMALALHRLTGLPYGAITYKDNGNKYISHVVVIDDANTYLDATGLVDGSVEPIDESVVNGLFATCGMSRKQREVHIRKTIRDVLVDPTLGDVVKSIMARRGRR